MLLSAGLVTEDLRLQGGLFLDPRSWNRNYSIAVRWNVGDLTSLELEFLGSGGDPLREPPLAFRQPGAILISFVRYF